MVVLCLRNTCGLLSMVSAYEALGRMACDLQESVHRPSGLNHSEFPSAIAVCAKGFISPPSIPAETNCKIASISGDRIFEYAATTFNIQGHR